MESYLGRHGQRSCTPSIPAPSSPKLDHTNASVHSSVSVLWSAVGSMQKIILKPIHPGKKKRIRGQEIGICSVPGIRLLVLFRSNQFISCLCYECGTSAQHFIYTVSKQVPDGEMDQALWLGSTLMYFLTKAQILIMPNIPILIFLIFNLH